MTRKNCLWVLLAAGVALCAVLSAPSCRDGSAPLSPVSPEESQAVSDEPTLRGASETPTIGTPIAERIATRESGRVPILNAFQTAPTRQYGIIGPIITSSVLSAAGLRGTARMQDDDTCIDGCWESHAGCVASAEDDFWGCVNGCPGPDSDLHYECRQGCLDSYRTNVRACNAELDSCEAGCP